MNESKLSVGWTSAVGLLVTLLGLVPIVGKVVQEGSRVAVHGPERWLAIGGLALGGVVGAGRYLQEVMGINLKLKLDVGYVVKVATGLLGLLPIVIKSYSEGAQALHSPEKYAALAGVLILAEGSLRRYLQVFTGEPVPLDPQLQGVPVTRNAPVDTDRQGR